MNKIRGFKSVIESKKKNKVSTILPKRGTKTSAGYDFYTPVELVIPPHEAVAVWTDVKAYMQLGEVLVAVVRSSLGTKKHLIMANTIGIIDQDYYSNPSNDGNIGINLYNYSNETVTIEAGERIVQCIFLPFLESDNCNTEDERIDGFGSTGTK